MNQIKKPDLTQVEKDQFVGLLSELKDINNNLVSIPLIEWVSNIPIWDNNKFFKSLNKESRDQFVIIHNQLGILPL